MAITTYAELQTAINNWTDRSGQADFTNRLTEFITLAENRLNRVLPVRTAEVDTTLTGTLSSRLIALPPDFREPVALFLTTFGVQEELAPIMPGQYALETFDGVPNAWMINGTNIELDTPCDQAHTFKFRYRMQLFDLATTSTNWLLTNHPDVYLFSCLTEAYAWAQEAQKAAAWAQRAQSAIEEVSWQESRSKSVAKLRVDTALQSPGSYNINADDY